MVKKVSKHACEGLGNYQAALHAVTHTLSCNFLRSIMKFTPSIDPKKPVFHDASSKVHVKFDSESGAQTVVPVTVKSDAKKRPSDEADIGTGIGQAQKKQKAQKDDTKLPRKQKTKGTPIDSPSKKPKIEKKDAKKRMRRAIEVITPGTN